MYRERQRNCPACDSMMEEVPVHLSGGETAQVDHCGRCGGVFLEFFDGEPVDLSRGILERDTPLAAETTPDRDSFTCPDCSTPMRTQRYMKRGPPVSRCDACMAVFATARQLRGLARFELQRPPPKTPSLLDRLRSFFFTDEDDRGDVDS